MNGSNGIRPEYDVVCLSHLRWDFVWQRPQQLMARCARERRVFFVEEPVLFDGATPRLEISRRDDCLYVITPHLPPGAEAAEAQDRLLAELLAEHLPLARMRPLEATYLAWLDLRAYGHDDPASACLATGRVWVAEGSDYHPGLGGHVRLNIATSPERLVEIVRRMASALA